MPKDEVEELMTSSDEDFDKTLKKWKHTNGIHIKRVSRLLKRGKPTATHESILVITEDVDAANKCIQDGFYFNFRHHRTAKFTPQLQVKRCYNCGSYGHRASQCKLKERCGRCGDNHSTKECKSRKQRCINCKGEHEVWFHGCPTRMAFSQELKKRRSNLAPFYST